MTCLLVQPKPPKFLTGGYLYNQKLAEFGACALIPLDDLKALKGLAKDSAKNGLETFDSLLMYHATLDPQKMSQSYALLIHHLASLDDHDDQVKEGLEAIEALWLQNARKVVVTSEFMAKTLENKHGLSEISICTPGVDLKASIKQKKYSVDQVNDPKKVQILSVGHIIHRKGYDLALKILEDLDEILRNTAWQWSIVGSSDLEPDYAREFFASINRSPIKSCVRYLGAKDQRELFKLYSEADLFFLPSRFESYGMVYSEALSQGCPVAAWNQGEILKIAGQGRFGLLLKDQETAAVQLAEFILNNRMEGMSRDISMYHKPRSWNQVADDFKRIFEPDG